MSKSLLLRKFHGTELRVLLPRQSDLSRSLLKFLRRTPWARDKVESLYLFMLREIKRSSAPKVERGFHSACDDLKPSQKWVVYPGQETYPLTTDIQAISLHGLCEKLALSRS